MDHAVRSAVRYLKTLPVRERLLIVLNLSDDKEVREGMNLLMDASHVSIMSKEQRALVVLLQSAEQTGEA